MKIVQISNYPLSHYVGWLKHNDYFALVRYGDGEWVSIFRDTGNIAHYQPLSPKFQADMSWTLTRAVTMPRAFLGMQNYAMRKMGARIEEFLELHDLVIPWVNADVLHYASRDGELYPFMKTLRQKKTVIIGPHYLKRLSDGVMNYAEFIEIPGKNCYKVRQEIIEKCLEIHKHLGDGAVYLFSAGPATIVLIIRLSELMPSNFFIHCGSIWDPFLGIKSRKYMKSARYTDQILRRNLGITTKNGGNPK